MNFLKRNNVNKNKRKSIKINPIIKRTALTILTLIIVCSAYSNRAVFARPIEFVAKNIAKVAVYSVLPSFDSRQENVAILNEAEAATTSPSRIIESTTLKATSTTAIATANKTTTTAKAKAVNGNAKGKISIEALGYGGANLALDNLHISNKTGLSVDLKKQLSIKPDIKIVKNKDPQVLIVHTHATEGYFPNVSNVYYDSWTAKSTDNSKNMIAVGNVMAQKLNKAGIVTIHDTTQHDKSSYSGSYERARVTTKSYLEKYPSIDIVLDLHRDAITYENGTKVRPTVKINGKDAAQIMICCGSNSGSVTGYDNWLSNFRFAIRLQQSCEKMYKNLARPLYFVSKKYNHDLCNGSTLIEVGSEANTLEEAKYSAELTANALIEMLKPLE